MGWRGRLSVATKALYDDALRLLRERHLVYACGCSRADLQRSASAPLGREPVYPDVVEGVRPEVEVTEFE